MAPRPKHDDPLLGRILHDKSGCWEWTGGHDNHGYALMYVGRGSTGKSKYARAIRLIYERMVGPIPPGRGLHHTCENHGCVNPAHLRPLTGSEHRLEHNRSRAMCANGLHPRTGDGLCAECRRQLVRRANWRRRTRTTGPTETCECGKVVAVGYLSRHQRMHTAVVR